MMTNDTKPAIQLDTRPTRPSQTNPSVPITGPAAVAALNAICETLGIKPTKGQDIGETTLSAVTAIKAERDELKRKLDGKPAMPQCGSDGVIVSASRQSREQDDKIVQDMIDGKTGVEI